MPSSSKRKLPRRRSWAKALDRMEMEVSRTMLRILSTVLLRAGDEFTSLSLSIKEGGVIWLCWWWGWRLSVFTEASFEIDTQLELRSGREGGLFNVWLFLLSPLVVEIWGRKKPFWIKNVQLGRDRSMHAKTNMNNSWHEDVSWRENVRHAWNFVQYTKI